MTAGKENLGLLYVEMSSLIARCSFDYIKPFKVFETYTSTGSLRHLSDLLKFRPTPPTMYPLLAHVLADEPVPVQVAVVQFYEALERWYREVSDLAGSDIFCFDQNMMARLRNRLGEVLEFALDAMEVLYGTTPDLAEIDKLTFSKFFSKAPDYRNSLNVDNPVELVRELVAHTTNCKQKMFGDGSPGA